MKGSLLISQTILLFIAILSCGCDNSPKKVVEIQQELNLSSDLYLKFYKEHSSYQIIVAEEGDINADGLCDLVLIYHNPRVGNRMCALMRKTDNTYEISNEFKAPVSNQNVYMRDIDDTPPVEFVVQGMKGAKTGFAIYRFVDGRIEDVFGEGMDDCC
ncbi:Cys-Cys-COOH (seleno)protein SaoC [Desulfopila sp. IMCC35008]|uniref:Cys-Cys-COOH (seleno)protein SaoC n=1 Tax=Desulfopila sp. IMCC35008 TaxID=2653858 RepID=UPI0013D820C3|nr:Cys-Cys-COOH (seleno)protein SaoC [Desulfopila sp. IMCC35008]